MDFSEKVEGGSGSENEQAIDLSMKSRVDADEEDDLDIIADLKVPPPSPPPPPPPGQNVLPTCSARGTPALAFSRRSSRWFGRLAHTLREWQPAGDPASVPALYDALFYSKRMCHTDRTSLMQHGATDSWSVADAVLGC